MKHEQRPEAPAQGLLVDGVRHLGQSALHFMQFGRGVVSDMALMVRQHDLSPHAFIEQPRQR